MAGSGRTNADASDPGPRRGRPLIEYTGLHFPPLVEGTGPFASSETGKMYVHDKTTRLLSFRLEAGDETPLVRFEDIAFPDVLDPLVAWATSFIVYARASLPIIGRDGVSRAMIAPLASLGLFNLLWSARSLDITIRGARRGHGVPGDDGFMALQKAAIIQVVYLFYNEIIAWGWEPVAWGGAPDPEADWRRVDPDRVASEGMAWDVLGFLESAILSLPPAHITARRRPVAGFIPGELEALCATLASRPPLVQVTDEVLLLNKTHTDFDWIARVVDSDPLDSLPSISLADGDAPPEVVGRPWKRRLGPKQRKAIASLLEFPGGLTTDELKRKTGLDDPVSELRNLRRSDIHMQAAIETAGAKGAGRYRIRTMGEARSEMLGLLANGELTSKLTRIDQEK